MSHIHFTAASARHYRITSKNLLALGIIVMVTEVCCPTAGVQANAEESYKYWATADKCW